MAKLLSLLMLGVIALLVSCGKHGMPNVAQKKVSPVAYPTSLESATPADTELWPSDSIIEQDHLTLNGYTIEKRFRKGRVDYGQGDKIVVDVAFVVIKKGKRLVATFDAGLASPLGNAAGFGLFPFLGGDTQQVFISEDLPRGGCQWIVSLSPRLRVIFDGSALGVGREGPDVRAVDLDHDGVYELLALMTDFYWLQDKFYMAAIPLPWIIFKYDSATQTYLPANQFFKPRALEDLTGVPDLDATSSNEVEHRSAVLSNLLTYVYVGDERRGWETFEADYKLKDKAEMRRRVKAILKRQPAYGFIYRSRKISNEGGIHLKYNFTRPWHD